MNKSITERLTKLESAAAISHSQIDTIIITAIRAHEGKPVERDVIGAGTMRNDWTIDRNPDESIEDFTERARALVPRKTTGAAMVGRVRIFV